VLRFRLMVKEVRVYGLKHQGEAQHEPIFPDWFVCIVDDTGKSFGK
jgi:hypothetical protein